LYAYDAVVVAVSHKEYLMLDEAYFLSLAVEQPKAGTHPDMHAPHDPDTHTPHDPDTHTPHAVLVDVKGLYRGKIKKLVYWSL
jgi:UDP-N-acetyl-D-galactosamine dehydrogenase